MSGPTPGTAEDAAWAHGRINAYAEAAREARVSADRANGFLAAMRIAIESGDWRALEAYEQSEGPSMEQRDAALLLAILRGR